jgi:hypothetical protein
VIYFDEFYQSKACQIGKVAQQACGCIPCCANMRKPLLPSPCGMSRCFSSIHPNNAIRWDNTRSRSRSSAVTGRGGTIRATCGVNVLTGKTNQLVFDGSGRLERQTIRIVGS